MNHFYEKQYMLIAALIIAAMWYQNLRADTPIPTTKPVTSQSADIRCCATTIQRDAKGHIKRSAKTIRDFQQLYPCPSTQKRTGPCPGWARDHVIPLAVGGYDVVENMQWLPNVVKSCANPMCKDRWERIIYKK